MKKHHIILPAVAAMAALPLKGCHNNGGKPQETTAIEQAATETDTPPTDTIDYERMRRMKILLRGSGKWELDK